MNAELSGVQQRNLEAACGVGVVDRVGLIIDIFGQRARTREARLQVGGWFDGCCVYVWCVVISCDRRVVDARCIVISCDCRVGGAWWAV